MWQPDVWRRFHLEGQGGQLISSDISQAASQAAQGLEDDAATQAREQTQQELKTMIHNVLDAKTYDEAEHALLTLMAHPLAEKIAKTLNQHLDAFCCIPWTIATV